MHYIEEYQRQRAATLSFSSLSLILLFTSMLTFVSFLLEAHTGINLSDEGHLWYSAMQAGMGGVPLRDFISYDPGRYYLVAAFMKLIGNNGIIASRIAETLIKEIGLFTAIASLSKLAPPRQRFNFLFLLISALTLLLWMTPLYKSFDFTLSILSIAVLAHFINHHTQTSCFWTGVYIGLIAIIGRNHGAYAAFGCLEAVIYLKLFSNDFHLKKRVTALSLGITTGYLPMLLMMLLIPGFASAFIESIAVYFTNGSTNIPLPTPWPWIPHIFLVYGSFFVALPLFAFASVSYIFLAPKFNIKVNSLFIAASLMAIPYAHYTFSRADSEHLALGIFPLLIGTLAFFARSIPKFATAIALLALSMHITLQWHPGWQAHRAGDWKMVDISGDMLRINQSTANDIKLFERLTSRYAPNGEPFLVIPVNLAMYPIFNRKAPVRDMYPLFKFKDPFDLHEIERLQKSKPNFIVLYRAPIGGHIEKNYQNMHPEIYHYILRHYYPISDTSNSSDFDVFLRTDIQKHEA